LHDRLFSKRGATAGEVWKMLGNMENARVMRAFE